MSRTPEVTLLKTEFVDNEERFIACAEGSRGLINEFVNRKLYNERLLLVVPFFHGLDVPFAAPMWKLPSFHKDLTCLPIAPQQHIQSLKKSWTRCLKLRFVERCTVISPRL